MTSTVNMTNAQEKTLYRVLKMANEFDYSRGKGEYEIKRYEVDDCEYFISVVIETGIIGDEGTLASVLCRDRVHLFIGKRGGITYPCYKNGKHMIKRFSKTNIFGVLIDQR